MKISETCAYIRAIGGVSGDMLLGALIHLGVDINFINNQLNCLDLGNIELGSFYNQNLLLLKNLLRLSNPLNSMSKYCPNLY